MEAATVFSAMNGDIASVEAGQSLQTAARLMRDGGADLLPVRGAGDRLVGVLTDRDITVRGVAEGKDPATCPVSDVLDGTVISVRGEDSLETVLRLMAERRVRSLPVVEGDRLVGVVSLADLAGRLPPEALGRAEARIVSGGPDGGDGPEAAPEPLFFPL